MKKIELTFSNTLTSLAGNKYGRQIYDEQVSGLIGDFDDVLIVFPDQITEIATSFLQGFFKVPVDEIGVEGINKNFRYKSNIANIDDVIKTALITMR